MWCGDLGAIYFIAYKCFFAINVDMDCKELFRLYDRVNSALGFANVDCAGRKCNFCENNIGHAFLFPLEDEYLNERTGAAVPSEDVAYDGFTVKMLGISEATGRCGFFEDGRCATQKLKPIECKLYPLIFYERGNSVNLELDLRCPEAKKIDKNYIINILPAITELAEFLPKEYFIARRELPDEMGGKLKTSKVATLRKI